MGFRVYCEGFTPVCNCIGLILFITVLFGFIQFKSCYVD